VFLGEGIFVVLDNRNSTCQFSGESVEQWTNAYTNPTEYPPDVFRDVKVWNELHPVFVWWHTLAHLLMRAIASEAGYSTASIRERVYFRNGQLNSEGGVLIYATQPESDGTLGGLIALVPYFQNILDVTFEQLETCSGDPLCVENRFQIPRYNGAACYACLLLPETSCEHRNMWLDRNIVLENRP
jgi:hypothetical protein